MRMPLLPAPTVCDQVRTVSVVPVGVAADVLLPAVMAMT